MKTKKPNKLKKLKSLDTTQYLISSEANRKRLDDAIAEMKEGKSFKHKLIEG